LVNSLVDGLEVKGVKVTVSWFLRKCVARMGGRYKWLGITSAGAVMILMVLTFRAVRSERH
jgi:hypothetical protein